MRRWESCLAAEVILPGVLLAGCGPAVGVGGGDHGSASDTGTTSVTGAETTGGTTGDGGTSRGETSQPDPETGGTPQPAALGCAPPLSCDKGTYEGSPVLETAQDAAELAGYTEVTGRLEISSSDFECLTFLACLETVGHDLSLVGNALLTDVTGLDNIATIGALRDGPLGVGGTLSVVENAALVDFNTLDMLEQTPVSLRIVGNDRLETISGLQSLVGTQEDLEIRLNPVLANIPPDGLPDVLFIGGECLISDNENLSASTVEDICNANCTKGPFNRC